MEDCTVKGIQSLIDGSYYGDRIGIIENVAAFSPIKNPYKLCMFVIMFVRSGRVEMTVNSVDYVLQQNDMFVVSPNFVLDKFNASVLADVCGLCFSVDCATETSASFSNRADVLLHLSVSPHLHATHAAIENMSGYVELLKRKFMEADNDLNEKIISALVDAAFNEMVGSISADADDIFGGYTSADTIFRNFLTLLDATKPRGRRVDEYAEKLQISPKYLSTVCRRKSGMTAIQVINKTVLADAINELRNDNKSIRDVAMELGFPNQSFFGTFMKKHTGLSPLQFRNRSLRGEEKKKRKKKE